MKLRGFSVSTLLMLGAFGSGCMATPALLPPPGASASDTPQVLELTYSEQTGQTCGGATFNLPNASSPSQVVLDGTAMGSQTAAGTIAFNTCGNPSPSEKHTMTYADSAGRIHSFSISIPLLTNVQIPSSISRSHGLTVRFSGPPLGAAQLIQATASGPRADSGALTTSLTTVNVSGQALTVPASAFNGMQNGSATVYFTRTSTQTINGARVVAKYVTRTFSASLVP